MNTKSSVTVEDVRSMKQPAKTFLCEVGANHYAIQFLQHSIEVYSSGTVLFSFRYSSKFFLFS